MPDDYTRFVRHATTIEEAVELRIVDDLAGRLRSHLAAAEVDIARVHIYRAPSKSVQAIVSSLLKDQLSLREERVIPAETGFLTNARPDFHYSLARGRGIIAEVERGGTTTNNHDLKDLWKKHIAADAQHLFLIVPRANWNESGLPRERPFVRGVQTTGGLLRRLPARGRRS